MISIGNVIRNLFGLKTSKMDVERVYDLINSIIPPCHVVRLMPERTDVTTVWDTKLGGMPYMPQGFEYPMGHGEYEGMPLKLLIQVNFATLPHIVGFPEGGILQVFCACDKEKGMYGKGARKTDMTMQDGFKVIYHKDIEEDADKLMSANDMPGVDDEGDFPFVGEFLLKAEKIATHNVTSTDYRFHDVAVKAINELYGKGISSLGELDPEFRESLYAHGRSQGCHIGGYSYFTQDDPRYEERYAGHQMTLIQIDSHQDATGRYDIAWGENGVANFLIEKDKLKNCDFSSVLYNWDC